MATFRYSGRNAEGAKVAGIVDGIDDEGSLILRTGGGRKSIVSSGEVTLRKE